MKSTVYAVVILFGMLCLMWSVAAVEVNDARPVFSNVTVSCDLFERIHETMTTEEVKGVMMAEPTRVIGEGRARFLVWHNTVNDKSITVTMRDGKVHYKTSQGL